MEFDEFAKWMEKIRDQALGKAHSAGDPTLHRMQTSINLLELAGVWTMHEVQTKAYAAQVAAEKWTKLLTILTALLVIFTIILAVLTARLMP
jgi:hypothetical protein